MSARPEQAASGLRGARRVDTADHFRLMADLAPVMIWLAWTDRRSVYFKPDPHRFENAPRLDKDHWHVMADPAWAHQVHHHYGVRPYWDDSGAAYPGAG